jgi:ABC-type multidrug transport system fused ATPase/permease subunit
MAALASIRRIEEFLQQSEKKDYRAQQGNIEGKDLSFGPAPDTVLLKQLSFSLPAKALTMVVGQVGSVSMLLSFV